MDQNASSDSAGEPKPSESGAATPHSPNAPVAGMMRKAVFWNALNFVFTQGAGIVIFLLIAARVPPHVFGVVALGAVVSDFVSQDGRVAAMDAILQADKFDARSLNTAFTSFLALVGLIAAVLALSAPALSTAFHEPLLTSFVPLFALMLLPVPWIAVMDALMMRDLRYRQTAERSIAATVVSGVIGIAVTFTPFLIWALLVQRVIALAMQAGLLYRLTRWLPRLSFQLDESLGFIRRFFALWIVNTLVISISRATLIIFGLRYSVVTVAFLRAANRIAESIQGPFISPLMGLWFPLMAKVRNDIKGERDVYNFIIRTAALTMLPAFAGLAIVSPDVVKLMLAPAYAGVTPLLQATAITMLSIPILWFNNVAFGAMGMNRVSLGFAVTLVSVSLLALYFSKPFSADHALLFMAIPISIVGIIGTIILNHRLKQTSFSFYVQLLPAVIATAVMAGATLWIQSHYLAHWPAILRLGASAAIGGSIYCGWLFLFHRAWFLESIHLLIDRRKDVASGGAEPVPAG